MATLTWHITIPLTKTPIPTENATDPIAFTMEPGTPTFQFQDGAGLRGPTSEETRLAAAEIRSVETNVLRASRMQCRPIPIPPNCERFFVLIKPVEEGALYLATMHEDSLGGALLDRAFSGTREKVTQLLCTEACWGFVEWL